MPLAFERLDLTDYDVIIDAPGTDGLRVGRHKDYSGTVFYVGEYDDDDIRSGNGIQVYYAADDNDPENYYMVQRVSSGFLNDMPNGSFSERILTRGNSNRDYVVKGESVFGAYDGKITLEYQDGDEILVFTGDFSDGKASCEPDTLYEGKYKMMIDEEDGLWINTPDPNYVYGITPYAKRIL